MLKCKKPYHIYLEACLSYVHHWKEVSSSKQLPVESNQAGSPSLASALRQLILKDTFVCFILIHHQLCGAWGQGRQWEESFLVLPLGLENPQEELSQTSLGDQFWEDPELCFKNSMSFGMNFGTTPHHCHPNLSACRLLVHSAFPYQGPRLRRWTCRSLCSEQARTQEFMLRSREE